MPHFLVFMFKDMQSVIFTSQKISNLAERICILSEKLFVTVQDSRGWKCDLIKILIKLNLCYVNSTFNKTNTNKRVKGRG